MATSPDHPELQFVQALKYAKGRPDGPPLWIVVHDMEASETRTRAEATANYFATLPDGRSVSSHYTADSDSVVQCVRLGDVAFTVGNRPGNYRGINWEFSGFAAQTRAQWLDPFGVAMFALAAPYIRDDAKKYGIPLVRRTVAELRARMPGVTSHNDLRLAFGNTTHTDPGPNFPWDYFMDLINQSDDYSQIADRGDNFPDKNGAPPTTDIILDPDRGGWTWSQIKAAYGEDEALLTAAGDVTVTGPVTLAEAAHQRIANDAFAAAQRAEGE
jgi:N-acetyl-anhydromuramyl-L-alanine amidase AmpD